MMTRSTPYDPDDYEDEPNSDEPGARFDPATLEFEIGLALPETRTWTSELERMEVMRQVRETSRHLVTIDDVIHFLMSEHDFFGSEDRETGRTYRMNTATDVRTARMITAITDAHGSPYLDRPSVLFLAIKHGEYIEWVDNARYLTEIERLANIVKASGDGDLKDELETLPRKPLTLKYRGVKRKKVAFYRQDSDRIDKAAEIRGVTIPAYLIITSVYSGLTSPAVPTEVIEYGKALIRRYKFLLEDRITDIKRLVDQTNL